MVCGDGEYIIYTAQALRNKSFGSALDFVWSAVGTGDYAVRESISKVKIFKNFKENKTIKPALVCPPASLSCVINCALQCSAEGLYGGATLAIRGGDCIVFYDWDTGVCVRKIDVFPKQVLFLFILSQVNRFVFISGLLERFWGAGRAGMRDFVLCSQICKGPGC